MLRRLRRLRCADWQNNVRLGSSFTTTSPRPEEIADLLPSAGARVLITSRFSDWSELADEVALDVLPLEEAVALLESRTGRSDAAGAKTLAEALGRLPLALDHAAAYCKRTQMQLRATMLRRLRALLTQRRVALGYPRSVAATFDLAITEAVTQCPAAEALMAYFAQCAPERIPMTLVEGAVEDEAERHESARRAFRSFACQARPIRGRHPCDDGASSCAGGGTSTVGGEWFGAGRACAPDCTAGDDLS